MMDTLNQKNFPQALAKESIRSGTIASIAMIPFGILFQLLGLRVGHYGKNYSKYFLLTFPSWHFAC